MTYGYYSCVLNLFIELDNKIEFKVYYLHLINLTNYLTYAKLLGYFNNWPRCLYESKYLLLHFASS